MLKKCIWKWRYRKDLVASVMSYFESVRMLLFLIALHHIGLSYIAILSLMNSYFQRGRCRVRSEFGPNAPLPLSRTG